MLRRWQAGGALGPADREPNGPSASLRVIRSSPRATARRTSGAGTRGQPALVTVAGAEMKALPAAHGNNLVSISKACEPVKERFLCGKPLAPEPHSDQVPPQSPLPSTSGPLLGRALSGMRVATLLGTCTGRTCSDTTTPPDEPWPPQTMLLLGQADALGHGRESNTKSSRANRSSPPRATARRWWLLRWSS